MLKIIRKIVLCSNLKITNFVTELAFMYYSMYLVYKQLNSEQLFWMQEKKF